MFVEQENLIWEGGLTSSFRSEISHRKEGQFFNISYYLPDIHLWIPDKAKPICASRLNKKTDHPLFAPAGTHRMEYFATEEEAKDWCNEVYKEDLCS